MRLPCSARTASPLAFSGFGLYRSSPKGSNPVSSTRGSGLRVEANGLVFLTGAMVMCIFGCGLYCGYYGCMNPHTSISNLVDDLSTARAHATALAWPPDQPPDLPTAYAAALGMRAARIQAGEVPAGYKVGFTNRSIWPIYQVYQPIWGTVWRSTLHQVPDGEPNEGVLSLDGLCEPRIEPELVFCLRASPPAGCDLAGLVPSIDWMAHGFEIVHTHFPGWKFSAAQAVADAGLHGLLLVGHRVKLAAGTDPQALAAALAGVRLKLYGNQVLKDQGVGANVLDGPLQPGLSECCQRLRQIIFG